MTPSSGIVSRFVAVFVLGLVGACATAAGDDADGGAGNGDGGVSDPADARPGAPDGSVLPPDASGPLPPDASTGVPCSSGAVCASPMTLPAISGDMGAQKQTAQGYQSAWYQIRVTEDVGGISGVSTSMEAKLTSPVGTEFDVLVYVNVNNDVAQECTTTVGARSVNGNVTTVLADWGETNGGLANGAGDGRNVSVEVRPVSGMCSVGQVWQLELTGNQ